MAWSIFFRTAQSARLFCAPLGFTLLGGLTAPYRAAAEQRQATPQTPSMPYPSGDSPPLAPAPLHPANGALRFALEAGALAALGFWGAQQTDDPSRYALMLGLPLTAAAAWGVFAVPNDRSRGGAPVVKVPGALRLALELGLFSFATWATADLGHRDVALGFAGATTLHYALSLDRVVWLLQR